MVVTYGVYENYATDPDRRHCNDHYANLVVECKSELIAEKIAELLNIDFFTEEL